MGNLIACVENAESKRITYDMSVIKNANAPMIWIVGPPGCGRTTQAEFLSQYLNFELISTAVLIKKEANIESKRGQIIAQVLKDGSKKVPDAVVIELLKEEILRRGKDVNGYIIDGFPRTSKQASQFVKEIKDVDAVIYLYSKVNEMISRVRQKKECVKQDEDIKNEIFDYIRDVKNGTIKFSTKIHKVYTDDSPIEVSKKIQSELDSILKLHQLNEINDQ